MEIETPDISRFVADIEKDKEFGEIIVHEHYVPPREAAYSTAITFSPEITRLLHQLGLEKLYTHQVEAIQHLRRGKSVLVSTPTASGKSLIYNLAVLEEIFKNRQAKALYLFPLKALEQDQLKTLIHWIDCLGMKDSLSAEIYDGDTTAYRRKKIRTHPPQILFTNPDMLHRGILPHHQSWEALFRNLSFVVLDEIHTYRGIFGSHMNQVIRRLQSPFYSFVSHREQSEGLRGKPHWRTLGGRSVERFPQVRPTFPLHESCIQCQFYRCQAPGGVYGQGVQDHRLYTVTTRDRIDSPLGIPVCSITPKKGEFIPCRFFTTGKKGN